MEKGLPHLECSVTRCNKNLIFITFFPFFRNYIQKRKKDFDLFSVKQSKPFPFSLQINFCYSFFYKQFSLFLTGSFFFLGCVLFFLSGCSPFEERTLSPKRATSRPYVINNQLYTPQHHYELTETGIASHYGGPDRCHGSLTATGERFSMFELTAAHKTLPLPCVILVENLENGKSIKVKVNDRGPFIGNRILDVSVEAAKQLGFYEKGLAQVRIRTLVDESVTLCAHQAIRKKQNLHACQTFSPKKGVHACYLSQQVDQVFSQSPRKIYVSVKVPSLGKALAIEEKLKDYGQTNLRRVHHNAPLHVTVGPFSSLASAQQVQKELACLCFSSTLIHE